MHIVGLTGRRGVGKHTIAGRMWAAHGFEELDFDAPIWAALSGAGVVDRARMTDPAYRAASLRGGKSPEQLAQEMREWGRGIDPAFWLKVTQQRFYVAPRGIDRVVFNNVRYDNEAAWIHEIGGQIWSVTRNPIVGDAGGISTKFINRGIVNDGSLDGLYWRVEQLVDELLHPHGEVVA